MATTNFNVSIFSVFQLVFWCFNTYPKTSMTFFCLYFCLFLFAGLVLLATTGTFCVYAKGIKSPYSHLQCF